MSNEKNMNYEEIDKLRKSPKNRIKELRLKNHLTLQELGDILKIGNNTISQYENHKRYPTINNFLALANYFKVSPVYLAGYDSDKTLEIQNELNNAIKEINASLEILAKHIINLYNEIDSTNSELEYHDERISDLENRNYSDSGADDYGD